MMQSLLPAIYPMLKTSFALDFGQIGLITLTFQLTASLLQPVVGIYTDRHPMPYSLRSAWASRCVGLLLLSSRRSFRSLLLAAALVGLGLVGVPPGVLARGADGVGRAARPRAVAVPGRRQRRLGARAAAGRVHRAAARAGAASPGSRSRRCSAIAHAAAGRPLVPRAPRRRGASRAPSRGARTRCRRRTVRTRASLILVALIFSKYFYLASLTSYYTFYLIHNFGVSVQSAQLHLFVFLGAVAAGTHHRRPDRRPHRPQAA